MPLRERESLGVQREVDGDDDDADDADSDNLRVVALVRGRGGGRQLVQVAAPPRPLAAVVAVVGRVGGGGQDDAVAQLNALATEVVEGELPTAHVWVGRLGRDGRGCWTVGERRVGKECSRGFATRFF